MSPPTVSPGNMNSLVFINVSLLLWSTVLLPQSGSVKLPTLTSQSSPVIHIPGYDFPDIVTTSTDAPQHSYNNCSTNPGCSRTPWVGSCGAGHLPSLANEA